MNIGRACGIFMNIDSEDFTEDEKLVAIRDVLKEMVTYNGITKDNILKAFRWFFDWAVEEASADSGDWIPCSERLPNDGEDVLIQPYWGREKYSYDVAEFCKDKWYCNQYTLEKDEVIAWMPLPPAFKGE